MMGTNDYLSQTPEQTYQGNVEAFIVNLHAANPNVPIYISAPINCATSLPLPMVRYQQAPGQIINSLNWSQLIGVDNGTLITDYSTQMSTDGIHPNDVGHAQMAAGWGAVIK
jgi:lysophospholipase L1-like esterase